MSTLLSEAQLILLSNFVHSRTAMYYPPNRWNDLEQKTLAASREMGFSDFSGFVQWLVSSPLSPEQQEILASNLTIPETYFWREPQEFDALVNEIFPTLIRKYERKEKRLRIWSAGCSSGEEPYSIAIAIHRLIHNRTEWNITILANDINPRILRKAMAGTFGDWSFRNQPPWFMEYFLRKADHVHEVIPEIREMVSFGCLNLAEDIFPSPSNNTNAMDIILCRNVLMYFSLEKGQQIVRKFFSALIEGGWLIVSGSEHDARLFPQFSPVSFPGAILYRKDSATNLEPSLSVEPPVTRRLKPESVSSPNAPTLLENPDDVGNPLSDCPTGNSVKVDAPKIRLLANQGKLSEAIAMCEKAIRGNKLDPSLHFIHATILQEQNKEIEAIASLRRAIYLDPNFVLAHYTMGHLLLHQENGRGAKRSFENVLDLLSAFAPEAVLPEFDGLTAGRLGKIVQAAIQTGELP